VIERVAAREFLQSLKGAQRAVLAQLMAGRTWREAGDALGCSSANVAYHMRRIRRRYAEWEAPPV
jgi:DNA-directed RNA polymerase specialized sigma24 family protein